MRKTRFLQAKKHNINGYSYHAIPDKIYNKAKLVMHGNKGFILGSVEDDYNSCDSLQNALESKKPTALILGDTPNSQLDFLLLGEHKFLKTPIMKNN